MTQASKLFLAVMALFIVGFGWSCNQSNTPTAVDSLRIEVNANKVVFQNAIVKQGRTIDSLVLAHDSEMDSVWIEISEVLKESRTDNYYTQKDIAKMSEQLKTLQAFCDKMAAEDPKNGKGWRILGQVIGEIIKRTVPGL